MRALRGGRLSGLVMRGLVALLGSWLAWPNGGSAQTALTWERGAGAEHCLERADVVRAVRARTGVVLQRASVDAERSLSARVVATKPGYHLLLKLRSADGRLLGARELADDSDDCTALGDAAVLTIALMIGPDRALPGKRAAEPAAARWRLGLRGGALASRGIVPAARVHGLLGLRLAKPRFALEFAAVAFGSARAVAAQRRVRFTPAYAQLGGCLGIARGAVVGFDACLGAQIGAIFARASGFTGENRAQRALLLAPFVRAPLGFRLSERFALVTAASLGVSLIRTRFEGLAASGERVPFARSQRLFFALELGLQLWL